MQFKGLVRFFTILLIIYSIYQLSFTWFVNGHENKMAAKALASIKSSYPEAKRYASTDDFPDSIKSAFNSRLKKLLDSTSSKTVTYGITGPISYQKAKAEELRLGLDLQGGMNVTLEVEMTGLLNTLANNSKDPSFTTALANAEKQKANSDRDFISLFAAEYKKLVGENKMASLFYAANSGKIKITDSDNEVVSMLRGEAKAAFETTLNALHKRIDQFGLAQPGIYPNEDKGTISVELPGIQDKDRIRKQLQAAANLQFWETYPLTQDLAGRLQQIDNQFDAYLKGNTITDSIVNAIVDTTVNTIADKKPADTTTLAGKLGANDTSGKSTLTPSSPTVTKKQLTDYLKVGQGPGIGLVNINDTADVRGFLTSAQLSRFLPGDARLAYGLPEGVGEAAKKSIPLYLLRTYNKEKAPIEGSVIKGAKQSFDQMGSKPTVSMEMTVTGSEQWSRLTEKSYNNGKDFIPIAIVMDGVVYSAPAARNGKIEGGNTEISGSFTVEQAQDLANLLKGGKISAPAKIVQEQEVGPTLGQQAVQGGTMAFLISFAVIFILMLVYYNTAGWVANIALILNLLFTVGMLTGLGFTLTAPGIAGLVLTIGMAVDTNVIIYERIKEELSKGKGYQTAINEGYKRSLPPVLDGHITIFLTALILFSFGLGPVKGFATTQMLGIALSLFCGILVSRWVSDMFTNRKRHLEYFTGISRKIFKHAKYKFIEYRKLAYGISIVVLLLGIASFFNGFNYGVEFDGGRSYTIHFPQNVQVEAVRNDLKAAFGTEPIIKTIGDTRTLDITTAYLINETGSTAGGNVDSLVLDKLRVGLSKHLPQGITYDQFSSNKYKVASKKVLPTISDDLKRGAVNATIFAILIIFLYIFIRFRDWRYSVGTIVALLHDVFVTLIVFSFFKNLVNFPLEIDQHFIAAVLTVIGFSMNDTVIVFDRIREDRKLYPSAPLGETINRAINETLSRTVMTSLTVFLTILVLFIFGGEVTRGFAFAMLIGVITGTYSSIFVAAPILVDLGKKKKATTVTGKV